MRVHQNAVIGSLKDILTYLRIVVR